MSFSKDPNAVLQDALQKGYSRVRFQQGKPVLDRELNLAADLASPERYAQGYIGDGVADTGAGFQITGLNVAGGDFTIKAGRALVAGREIVLAADTTYKGQPNKANVAPLPAGTSTVSLRSFTRTVTEADDASLKNSGAGDVGVVTSIREKADWEVVVTAGANAPAGNLRLATIDTGANTVTDRRRTGLNIAAVRDEMADARGSQARVADRLAASLDAAGALKPNSVGASQITDGSVGVNELADGSVTANKIGAAAVAEQKLADNSVSKRTIQDDAVSITELSKSLVHNQQHVVPAAPAAGQLGQLVVTLQVIDADAFFLVSVRQMLPRNPSPFVQSNSVMWKYRATAAKLSGLNSPYTHSHQILIENPNTFDVTVFCKAFRINDT